MKINNLNHNTKYAITGFTGSSLYANRNIKSSNVVATSIQKNDIENGLISIRDINNKLNKKEINYKFNILWFK